MTLRNDFLHFACATSGIAALLLALLGAFGLAAAEDVPYFCLWLLLVISLFQLPLLCSAITWCLRGPVGGGPHWHLLKHRASKLRGGTKDTTGYKPRFTFGIQFARN